MREKNYYVLVMRKSYEWENCVYHEVKVANCDYVMNGIV